LNISIRDGALVEIKGVQELELVSLVVENEVQRQLNLLKVRSELMRRGIKERDIKDEFVDITYVFAKTKCKVIRAALEKDKQVLAAKLPKFEGLLKRELIPDLRLGTEMADRAKFWGRVGGIFHTDELPAYGITSEEVAMLKRLVKAKPSDVVVFVADNRENASDALKAVNERAREALKEVPQETRAAKPDGSTRYMRPRAGAARMYPETDVPPIQISRDYVESLRKRLPELPEQKIQRLMRDYRLNKKLAKQILDSKFSQLFEETVKESKASPTLVAVTFTETLKALKREGVKVENVSDGQFLKLFRLVSSGKVAKEAVSDVIVWLSQHENAKVVEAINALGLGMLSKSELKKIIDNLIEENRSLLINRGEKAFGILMGLVMKKVRGRAKAKCVSELVKNKLEGFKK
jgi:glutamyl-tRNA(Gln) amidotransferase subunit E